MLFHRHPFIRQQHIPSTSTNSQKTQHRSIFAHPTWVTFSVTLWVRSISLHGAMMSISPVGRAMSGSGLKSTKFKVIWGIFEIARYRIRSESDVEFKIFDLLLTAPVEVDRKKRPNYFYPQNSDFALTSVLCTCAATALPDAGSPVLPVPVRPHGLDLINWRGSPHAVDTLPRSAVWQGAVWARTVSVEAEVVVRRNTGWRLGVRAHQMCSVWGRRQGRRWCSTVSV